MLHILAAILGARRIRPVRDPDRPLSFAGSAAGISDIRDAFHRRAVGRTAISRLSEECWSDKESGHMRGAYFCPGSGRLFAGDTKNAIELPKRRIATDHEDFREHVSALADLRVMEPQKK
jgi:hypothetical protein